MRTAASIERQRAVALGESGLEAVTEVRCKVKRVVATVATVGGVDPRVLNVVHNSLEPRVVLHMMEFTDCGSLRGGVEQRSGLPEPRAESFEVSVANPDLFDDSEPFIAGRSAGAHPPVDSVGR